MRAKSDLSDSSPGSSNPAYSRSNMTGNGKTNGKSKNGGAAGSSEDPGNVKEGKARDRVDKWRNMSENLDTYITRHNSTFMRRVRKGIPSEFRWKVWRKCLDIENKKIPKFYDSIKRQPNKWGTLIRTDIGRTFPNDPRFDSIAQEILFRILSAYANHNPEVGYCQGMNFIAGFMWLISEDEEDTFWMFATLMDNGLQGFYLDQFPMLQKYSSVFETVFERELPELRAHLKKVGVQKEIYLHQWLLTLFVSCLPPTTVLGLWDLIVCGGLHEILPIIIAILKILQKTLIKMDFENIVRFLKTMKDGDQDLPGGEIASLMIRTSVDIKIPPDIQTLLKDVDVSGMKEYIEGSPKQHQGSYTPGEEGNWFANMFNFEGHNLGGSGGQAFGWHSTSEPSSPQPGR